MKKVKFQTICLLILILIAAALTAAFFTTDREFNEVNILAVGAEGVVPAKDELINNLTQSGYIVTEYDEVYGVAAQRVVAEKGSKFIDICYGLDEKQAENLFGCYESRYADTNYYILAQNENFVYCISDKITFRKSGFTSTANIGVQYIHESSS